MKVIVGLGNPGKEYKDTRHNIGFMVLQELGSRYMVERQDCKFDAIIGHIRIDNQKVLLVKPLTYMNLSGRAVQPLMHWYKLNLEDLIVVYDDMDLSSGMLRIRPKGGSGGHKGLKSIVERLGSNEFARMRVGIGRPDRNDSIDWVLGRLNGEEKEQMNLTIKNTADALETWVKNGIEKTMNTYN
ncbi:MAG: aminoacyl-tRNA hydrolase [Bacillota bacterium]|nr:aminoacyl-tRNA hydrolase [Bacillota bacterium]